VPKLDCTKVTGEADPCDRPQRIRTELFLSTMLHHYTIAKRPARAAGHMLIVKWHKLMKRTSWPVPAIGRILLHHIRRLFAVST
jgi:hypothetical protein